MDVNTIVSTTMDVVDANVLADIDSEQIEGLVLVSEFDLQLE